MDNQFFENVAFENNLPEIVFCYMNLSNLLGTKGFDTINYPFTRNDSLENEIRKQILLQRQSRSCKSCLRFSLLKEAHSVYRKLYSGKP